MDWRILLAHHPPHEAGRCVHLPGLPPLCRRCLALYPAAFAVSVAQLAWGVVPPSAQLWVMILLPLPVTVAFVLEQIGRAPYSARGVVLGSLVMAPALGVGLARYLVDPADRLFWGMVLIFGVPALAAVIYHRLGGPGSTGSEEGGHGSFG